MSGLKKEKLRYAYHRPNGEVVFTTEFAAGEVPPQVDDLVVVELQVEPSPSPGPEYRLSARTLNWADPRAPQEKRDQALAQVRAQRDRLLAATDYTQLPDVTKDRQKWAVYRQALRDITAQPDPFSVSWPAAPA